MIFLVGYTQVNLTPKVSNLLEEEKLQSVFAYTDSDQAINMLRLGVKRLFKSKFYNFSIHTKTFWLKLFFTKKNLVRGKTILVFRDHLVV